MIANKEFLEKLNTTILNDKEYLIFTNFFGLQTSNFPTLPKLVDEIAEDFEMPRDEVVKVLKRCFRLLIKEVEYY